MFEVNGKTIAVTGASSGIGQAMASHRLPKAPLVSRNLSIFLFGS